MSERADAAAGEDAGLSRPWELAALWVGFLGGPAVWFAHLGVSYNLVRYVCLSGDHWLLHLATGIAVAAGAGVLWLAWRNWRRTGRPGHTGQSGEWGRSRFLALAGLLFAGYSLALIAVEAIPTFLLEACP